MIAPRSHLPVTVKWQHAGMHHVHCFWLVIVLFCSILLFFWFHLHLPSAATVQTSALSSDSSIKAGANYLIYILSSPELCTLPFASSRGAWLSEASLAPPRRGLKHCWIRIDCDLCWQIKWADVIYSYTRRNQRQVALLKRADTCT